MNASTGQTTAMDPSNERAPLSSVTLRVLETPAEMRAVEELSAFVWPGSDLDVVPAHLLLTVAHNGGLVAGAFSGDRLVGFVFGFPGLQGPPDGLRPKHCSHQLAVHPDYRSSGVGFALKRLQWRFVRDQGLDRVTWTYDPLLSRNAHLNIAKLGAVCNTYLRDAYGELRDDLNAGLATDRFQVDWWINSCRVLGRMQDNPEEGRPKPSGSREAVDFDITLLKRAVRLNPPSPGGLPAPPRLCELEAREREYRRGPRCVLIEIPPDFPSVKASDAELALNWRMHTRACFEHLFGKGFAVTGFIHRAGPRPRATYVLTRSRPGDADDH